MPTVFVKDVRIYIAVREEELDLAEEGWEPVARVKSLAHALRLASFLADKFDYVLEWG